MKADLAGKVALVARAAGGIWAAFRQYRCVGATAETMPFAVAAMSSGSTSMARSSLAGWGRSFRRQGRGIAGQGSGIAGRGIKRQGRCIAGRGPGIKRQGRDIAGRSRGIKRPGRCIAGRGRGRVPLDLAMLRAFHASSAASPSDAIRFFFSKSLSIIIACFTKDRVGQGSVDRSRGPVAVVAGAVHAISEDVARAWGANGAAVEAPCCLSARRSG
jgi:hypothetical protein